MRETIQKPEQAEISMSQHTATSQGGITIQLGLSHLVASAVALGLFFLLTQFHIQQMSALLIALVAAGICGLLCTLNLQYSLSMLELALSRFAQGLSLTKKSEVNGQEHFGRRWPLGSLFLRLQELERRVVQYESREQLTADLREKALRQASEAAALAERNRIARELHDSIKQQIFSISVSAAAAKAHWQDKNTDDARRAVEDIQNNVREAQVEMQALLQQLRPAPLENTSLIEALHIQAQALGFRTGARIFVDLEALPTEDRLLPGTQEAIFRLVQEAFANSTRHARAQTIWLEARVVESTLYIEVRDDGRGFDTASVRNGMGLTNLQERAKELHGSAVISSQPGQGTTVLINIPLLESLRSPAEEARQKYELARLDELARRSYNLCSNASFLSLAMGLIGLIAPLPLVWSLTVFGGLLVAFSGYISGIYYSIRVAWNAGQESRAALELAQYRHKVGVDLARLISLGGLYVINLMEPLRPVQGRWLFIGAIFLFAGLLLFSRRSYRQDTDRYYSLLSRQELGWELENRGQTLIRSLTIWSLACAVGLISAHHLFVFPPQTLAQENVYGIAILLFLMGVGLLSSYMQIQRWKRRLRQPESSGSARRKEEEHG